MRTAKVAISLDRKALVEVDRLVRQGVFPSRSRLIQDAVAEKLGHLGRGRLARECAKLDPDSEQAMAEEAYADEARWPAS